MRQSSVFLAAALGICAVFAVGCGAGYDQGSEGAGDAPAASGDRSAVTWCTTGLSRSGTIAGTSLDYPSTPDTTWFNNSLEEVALTELDKTLMEDAGLSIDDDADVRRFRYFTHGFDFRWIVGDEPSPGNWFGKSDFSVYLFDVVETATPIDAKVAVFDASAVRDARLSGDKNRLASAIRTTVDAMKADHRAKAIIAFAPDRNPETSVERAFINLFARDVHFATSGTVAISNLRDPAGAPVTSVSLPLHNVRTLDLSAQGDMAGAPFVSRGSCLDLQISG